MVHKLRDHIEPPGVTNDTYNLAYRFGYTSANPPPEPGTAFRGHNVLAFATSTVQDGKPVTVDVCYVYQPGGTATNPVAEQGRLIRLRDRTGPDAATKWVDLGAGVRVYYQLGDDRFWAAGTATTNNLIGLDDIPTDMSAGSIATFNSYIYSADVMMINVRSVQFFVVDPPPTGAAAATQLNPRTLPAGIRMVVLYGPEVGNIDQMHRAEIFFPVQRGL